MADLVRFGLSSVHYATGEPGQFGTPVPMLGAVQLTTTPEGDSSTFYADNKAYAVFVSNNGYTGSLEIASVNEQFLRDVVGYRYDNTTGLFYEVTNFVAPKVSLLFEINGNEERQRVVLYGVTFSRPQYEHNTTSESTEPDTVTIEFTATGFAFTINGTPVNVVKAQCSDSAENTKAYDSFFTTVPEVGENTSGHDVYYGTFGYDEKAGEYVGLGTMFLDMRDGKAFAVDVPLDGGTTCVKMLDNSGIQKPVPSTIATPGYDPYRSIPMFYWRHVNGYPDANGVQRVTALSGDANFERDGSNGAVNTMIPAIFYSVTYDTGDPDTAKLAHLVFSNTPLPGLKVHPEFVQPDGSIRPFALLPTYALAMLGDEPTSASGLQPLTRTVSHDSLKTIVAAINEEQGTSWSGRTRLVDWYVNVMFLLKYATRDAQSVMKGCTSYDLKYQPVNATSNENHIDVPANMGLVEGSAIMVGSEDVDRGAATGHDVVDYAVIKSIDTSNDGYARLALDRPVTVATTNWVKTAPWPTGACDAVQGDGSPTSNTSGKEPYVIQGIECSLGMYEVMDNVTLHSDGATGWEVMVSNDVDDDYVGTGVMMPSGDTDAWHYPLNIVDADGFICGTNDGGSTTSGMCDGTYTNKTSTAGDREVPSVGNLWSAGGAGPAYRSCYYGLGSADWYIGSRLSATRRSGGEAA